MGQHKLAKPPTDEGGFEAPPVGTALCIGVSATPGLLLELFTRVFFVLTNRTLTSHAITRRTRRTPALLSAM